MKPGTIILLLLLPLASASKQVPRKVFVFPEESDTAYLQLTPQKPLDLQAFTLCMRIATDVSREMILFAYRTVDADELNVWQESDGTLSLYLRSSRDPVKFTLPPLSPFKTHLCVTWNSSTGATTFWVNGRRSVLKIYKQGHRIRPDGAIILGQDADKYLGKFDYYQSFVGEITEVNMWDRVLTAGHIEKIYEEEWDAQYGNVLSWKSLQYQIYGHVLQESDLI